MVPTNTWIWFTRARGPFDYNFVSEDPDGDGPLVGLPALALVDATGLLVPTERIGGSLITLRPLEELTLGERYQVVVSNERISPPRQVVGTFEVNVPRDDFAPFVPRLIEAGRTRRVGQSDTIDFLFQTDGVCMVNQWIPGLEPASFSVDTMDGFQWFTCGDRILATGHDPPRRCG